VKGLAFGPNNRLVSASELPEVGDQDDPEKQLPGEVIAWDATRPQVATPLAGHRGAVAHLSFSRDGKLATANRYDDRSVVLWDVAEHRPLRSIPSPGSGFSPEGLSVRPAGNQVAVAFTVIDPQSLVRPKDKKETEELRKQGKMVRFFEGKSGLLRAIGLPGELRIYRADDGKEVRTLRSPPKSFTAIAFSPDDRLLAAGIAEDSAALTEPAELALWDADTYRSVRVLSGHTSPIHDLCFSGDGTRLASVSWREAIFWDVGTGQKLGTFHGHRQWLSGVAVSPDGTRVATCGWDGKVILWDSATGEPLRPPLRGHAGRVQSVCFSPDGERLASGGEDRTVRIWSARTGAQLLIFMTHSDSVGCVRFDPSGKVLATAGGPVATLWDAHPLPTREP
jgi:WD40 repeat protein